MSKINKILDEFIEQNRNGTRLYEDIRNSVKWQICEELLDYTNYHTSSENLEQRIKSFFGEGEK